MQSLFANKEGLNAKNFAYNCVVNFNLEKYKQKLKFLKKNIFGEENGLQIAFTRLCYLRRLVLELLVSTSACTMSAM